MTANRLQFQEGGHQIWITIPPRVEDEKAEGEQIEPSETKMVSLDNLYSASSDRRQQQQESGGTESLAASKLPFVWKLYEMLEDVESSNQEGIVSWVRNGTGFKVHNLEKFVDEIIPKYCKLSKYKSFQRQLYFYGFTRITKGPDTGAYHHPMFIRGQKTLCLSMAPKNSRRRRSSKDSTSTVGDNSSTAAASCMKRSAQQVAQHVARMERCASPSSHSTASRDCNDAYAPPLPCTTSSPRGIPRELVVTRQQSQRQPSSDQWIANELQELLLEEPQQHNQDEQQQQMTQEEEAEHLFGMSFHSVEEV